MGIGWSFGGDAAPLNLGANILTNPEIDLIDTQFTNGTSNGELYTHSGSGNYLLCPLGEDAFRVKIDSSQFSNGPYQHAPAANFSSKYGPVHTGGDIKIRIGDGDRIGGFTLYDLNDAFDLNHHEFSSGDFSPSQPVDAYSLSEDGLETADGFNVANCAFPQNCLLDDTDTFTLDRSNGGILTYRPYPDLGTIITERLNNDETFTTSSNTNLIWYHAQEKGNWSYDGEPFKEGLFGEQIYMTDEDITADVAGYLMGVEIDV